MELNPPLSFAAVGWDPWLRPGGAESQADPLLVIEGTAAMAGVIGGALIVFSRGEFRNFTTAAHIWLAAAIGVAFGAGLYPLAIIGTAASVILISAFHWVARKTFGENEERADGEG